MINQIVILFFYIKTIYITLHIIIQKYYNIVIKIIYNML